MINLISPVISQLSRRNTIRLKQVLFSYDRRIDAVHLMHAVDLDPEPIPALEFDQTLG